MNPDELSRAGHFHPSVFHASAGPLRQAETEPRASGAMRYRCPVSASFVLVTEEPILESLRDRPALRRRCPACGEMHLLCVSDDEADDA
ncbi:hypothetical protein [Undibacter mobilis]|uniref:Uncharacterized protein n=1 Tax=Undibacter mobilis TaxID=2292256 RepID=A0A371B6R1_9BRAD|nr:hypothetical protein [Undibacter mobilis]RDV03197.1 hypothetical protein DXH78_00475 [Undibacter mobilis]